MSTVNRNNSEITVVVVDGQDVVHAGIEAWVTGSHPRVKIVAHYTNPSEFISDRASAVPVVDVVLFALEYDDRGPAFDALRRVCDAGHRVIVYSRLVNDEIILTALETGAVTYVAKSESGYHLAQAIYAAVTGSPYAAPHMAQALINKETVGRPHLSKREREVLIAWFQTENKDMVAKRLFIGPSTVRTHLQRVRAKYAAVCRPAPTKAALVARAIQDGILSADDL